ncbi:hypothetical protein AB0N92_16520 [Streptomyces sp. NPDC093248]|uniref:hypothetical protein n=1 Tax=Streptomyces sp. NPDC093248 TaxID=3155072 RepID=UPI00343E88CA
MYQVSKDVVGAVAQVQKTTDKARRLVSGELHRHYRDDGSPTDTSFEQYRRSIQDVEVITFDELYERACFIVEDR